MDAEGEVEVLYVELLDDGTACYRPVTAEVLGGAIFRILEPPGYSSLDERWAFEPGSIVKARPHRSSAGDEFLLAVSAGVEAGAHKF